MSLSVALRNDPSFSGKVWRCFDLLAQRDYHATTQCVNTLLEKCVKYVNEMMFDRKVPLDSDCLTGTPD